MAYQQTSFMSYLEVKKNINKRQQQILDCFQGINIALNNRQLSVLSKLPINCTVPRVNELVKNGILKEAFRDKDSYTGRTTIYWKLST